jgi:UDP-N-acetyl-D-glucosamine/UDP-N-acetyl-D-galactosamine dehydrogenase
MQKQFQSKEKKIGVIGLGYVGLPVALSFARQCSVIGFDINAKRVALLNNHIDPSNELSKEEFDGTDIFFTDDLNKLREANFFIVCVPTPVDEHNVPDISLLKKASRTVGSVIKKGDYVVYESTVYPGCTEEECIPLIEHISGLTAGKDFKYGYSPERINPGDREHNLSSIIKVVSGCDDEARENIASAYSMVVKAGIHKASSVKVAEAAKVIENTQRDLNIALMNELSMIFDKMGINTYEVLEAAGTKWNFLPFRPGLVGGHCIGVDPYYLTYKAAEIGHTANVITAGRHVNDNMSKHIASKIIQHIIEYTDNVKDARVLVMGTTFKENVTDIRNSKVADIVNLLTEFHLNVEITDPHADHDELMHEYGFGLTENAHGKYDAVIIAVPHDDYKKCDTIFLESITHENAMIADLKGIYRHLSFNRKYWTL